VIYSSDLFTYNAKYFQTLPREKWRSFTNRLRSMLKLVYGVPFVKVLYLTDLAQKLLSLAEIAISACRDVICGRDSYLCMRR